MQGSESRKNYVVSFWIDYSQDNCTWQSHTMGEVNIKDHDYNPVKHDYFELDIWPAIEARFIRIRPSKIHGKVAIKLGLYGHHNIISASNLAAARIVTIKEASKNFKKEILEKTRNMSLDTKIIQVDCQVVIRQALERAGLLSVGFLQTNTGQYVCIFSTSNKDSSERALNELAGVGLGRDVGILTSSDLTLRKPDADIDEFGVVKKKEVKTLTFAESIRSRQIVEAVLERVENSAHFTFDYISLLISASLIAGAGLAANSAVVVVASMLVSPLMGPVLAITFGASLKRMDLVKLGLKNEIWSLLICFIIGFILGYLYPLITDDLRNWPTEEMSGRGDPISLADGAFIAAASGIGIALSVLGEYVSTVIGVAISASLLPPAVNSGMYVSFALYELQIDKSTSIEMFTSALFSMILVIENIIIIILVGLLFFAIKRVYVDENDGKQIWKSVTNWAVRHNRQPIAGVNLFKKRISRQISSTPITMFGKDENFETMGTIQGIRMNTGKIDKKYLRRTSVLENINAISEEQMLSGINIKSVIDSNDDNNDDPSSSDSEEQSIAHKKSATKKTIRDIFDTDNPNDTNNPINSLAKSKTAPERTNASKVDKKEAEIKSKSAKSTEIDINTQIKLHTHQATSSLGHSHPTIHSIFGTPAVGNRQPLTSPVIKDDTSVELTNFPSNNTNNDANLEDAISSLGKAKKPDNNEAKQDVKIEINENNTDTQSKKKKVKFDFGIVSDNETTNNNDTNNDDDSNEVNNDDLINKNKTNLRKMDTMNYDETNDIQRDNNNNNNDNIETESRVIETITEDVDVEVAPSRDD